MLFTKLWLLEKSGEHGGMTVNIHKHLVIGRDAIDGEKSPILVSKVAGVEVLVELSSLRQNGCSRCGEEDSASIEVIWEDI